jgi:hypothetical protein
MKYYVTIHSNASPSGYEVDEEFDTFWEAIGEAANQIASYANSSSQAEAIVHAENEIQRRIVSRISAEYQLTDQDRMG